MSKRSRLKARSIFWPMPAVLASATANASRAAARSPAAAHAPRVYSAQPSAIACVPGAQVRLVGEAPARPPAHAPRLAAALAWHQKRKLCAEQVGKSEAAGCVKQPRHSRVISWVPGDHGSAVRPACLRLPALSAGAPMRHRCSALAASASRTSTSPRFSCASFTRASSAARPASPPAAPRPAPSPAPRTPPRTAPPPLRTAGRIAQRSWRRLRDLPASSGSSPRTALSELHEAREAFAQRSRHQLLLCLRKAVQSGLCDVIGQRGRARGGRLAFCENDVQDLLLHLRLLLGRQAFGAIQEPLRTAGSVDRRCVVVQVASTAHSEGCNKQQSQTRSGCAPCVPAQA